MLHKVTENQSTQSPKEDYKHAAALLRIYTKIDYFINQRQNLFLGLK